jgi:SAM-dependent methyltransferase
VNRGAGLIRGDALRMPLRDESVDLVISSPPYFALRSYQDDGEHYAGQIGSEPTPADFLAALWAVMDECWRVLKPTGSCWVNLGDSYSRGQRWDNEFTTADAAWLAGLIDADGTITVRHTQQPQMRAPSFEGIIAVEQSDLEAVTEARRLTGRGNLVHMPSRRGARPSWRWTVSTRDARWVAERIWPWLQIKRRQALAVVELARHREHHNARGGWRPIKPEWIEYRQQICDAVRAWNARQPFDWEPPLR